MPKSYNKIVFFHLPKTGGLSLKQAFQNLYNHVILDSYTFLAYKSAYNFHINKKHDNLRRRNNVSQNENRCPCEFVYVHDWTTENPFSNIELHNTDFGFTILRHPISQFYSLYYHIKNGTPEESATPILHGLVHQMIMTSKDINEYIDWILDFGYLVKKQIIPIGYYNENLLNKMKFVGIFERYNETIKIIQRKLDIELDVRESNIRDYEKNYDYKFDELYKFFANEINIYLEHKSNFDEMCNKLLKQTK
jgi:hypothetical protein